MGAGAVVVGPAVLELASATVVGVTCGGGLGLPEASGGGLVGVMRLDPKMFTSICCASGCSTVSTSPRSPNPLAASVGRFWACRLWVEGVVVEGQPDQLVETEAVVDLHALVDRADEGVDGERADLRLGGGDQGLDEHVLALDPAEVARPVVLPVAVGVVLVVARPPPPGPAPR